MMSHHLCVVRVSLFQYIEKTAQYDDFGEVGCTIIGSNDADPAFKLGCYNAQNEYVCTSTIGPSNEAGANVALQGSYISFKDDAARKTWSLQFNDEEEAIAFCGSVAVAMYGAAGQPTESLLVCDVAKGSPGKVALAGSLAKVRFSSWVVQRDSKSGLPALGSQLEHGLLSVQVPTNHLATTPAMEGFEGMLVGMREQGCRFVVVPRAAHRGRSPRVDRCFFVEMVRIRTQVDEDENDGAATWRGSGSLAVAGSRRAAPAPSAAALAASPGFDREQFMLVDRLRDNVFTLTEQLREARQQLQTFGADVRAHEQRRQPKSLLNAQIEYSTHRLLVEADEQRDRLSERDEALARLQERNAQLRHSLEKYQDASRVLSEDKVSSLTALDEEKLELDRQILQAQTHLNRLSTEVEDTLRHINSVKRLLDQSTSDLKKDKGELQVSLVSFQTSASRLAAVKESLHEEAERCTLLESRAGLLGMELQTLQDDMAGKNRAIEECRRRSESDVLHYEQLLEDERHKAAEELRGVRQGLLEELAARGRRYQEERQRIAQEAYDRGRVQGLDDGAAEVQLAADLKAREMTLLVQRNNAEAAAMEGRVRVAKEEKAADQRRMRMEKEAAEGRVADEGRPIAALEQETATLTLKRDLVTARTFDALDEAIQTVRKGKISQHQLLRIIAAVQAGDTDVDFSLGVREELENDRRQAQEKSEVEAWVRAAVYNQQVQLPPLRQCCAAAPPPRPGEDERTGNDDFMRLNDILRIREINRAARYPEPVTVPSLPAMPVVASPHVAVAEAAAAQTRTVAATPGFIARNPFQQLAPPQPHVAPAAAAVPPPQQLVIQPQPQWQVQPPSPAQQPQPQFQSPPPQFQSPQLQLRPLQPQPQLPQPPLQAQNTVAAGPRVSFPAPHIRPLSDYAPPPSLNH